MNAVGFAFCFLVGILIMGSEGDWFPWVNLAGCVLFAFTLYFARRAK